MQRGKGGRGGGGGQHQHLPLTATAGRPHSIPPRLVVVVLLLVLGCGLAHRLQQGKVCYDNRSVVVGILTDGQEPQRDAMSGGHGQHE